MAKNIEINIKTSTGVYETLYPSVNPEMLKLNSGNVNIDNSISESLGLGAGSTINDVLGKLGSSGVYSDTEKVLILDYGQKVEEIQSNSVGQINWDYDTCNITGKSEWCYHAHQQSYEYGTDTYKYKNIYVVGYNVKTKEKIEYTIITEDFGYSYSNVITVWGNDKIIIGGAKSYISNDTEFNFTEITDLSSTSMSRGCYFQGNYLFATKPESGQIADKFYSSDGRNWIKEKWNLNAGDAIEKMIVYKNVLYLQVKSKSGYGKIYKLENISEELSLVFSPSSVETSPSLLYINYFSIANNNLFLVCSSDKYYDIVIGHNMGERIEFAGNSSSIIRLESVFYSNKKYYGLYSDSSTEKFYTSLICWDEASTGMAKAIITNNKKLYQIYGTTLILWKLEQEETCVWLSGNSTSFVGALSSRVYTQESVLTDALGVILNLGDSYRKIELTSYIGSGLYGSSNPNNVTFSFNPKLVIILLKNDTSPGYKMISLKGQMITGSALASSTTIENTITWINNGLSWYTTASQDKQLNVANTEYIVLGIG